MNWEHLKTYIWVRWRLSANQVRRSGTVGIIITAILTGLRVMGGIVTFIAGLLLGFFVLGQADMKVLIFTWDGVAGAFIFFWLIGLMSELQRTELLSLDNFMHLPVSPTGAFLINYVGSSFGLSLILFFPAMVGLSAGILFSRGLEMLLLFPLVAVFFLMVTAVTYQFRGWLAGMMSNPRRRRMIIAIVSLAFILIFQIPNILTNFTPGARSKRQARQEITKEFSVLKKELDEGSITQEGYESQLAAKQAALKLNRKQALENNYKIIQTVNMTIPPGWLPYGAGAASQGRYLPVLACILGMGLIGIGSLRLSYRATIRLYMGDFNKGRARRKDKVETVPEGFLPAKKESNSSTLLLEKKLPWISEQATATTLMCFRSMIRAPEVKMMLLTPVILMVVFGGMLVSKDINVSGLVRLLLVLGSMAFMLVISMTGFVGNQFAFDRNGFRTFVLSCTPRRDILLGKNLSLVPVVIILMTLIIGVFQWMNPMQWDHLITVFLLMVPMYLIFCLVENMASILAPVTLKQGSGRPASHQGFQTLLQMIFMVVVPIPMSVTLIPVGLEALYVLMNPGIWFPVSLVFSAIEVIVVVRIYRALIQRQGILLQRREQKILEVVSTKGE